jgi:hypothetical protein
MPDGLFPLLGLSSKFNIIDPTERYLKEINERVERRKWYFGHFHVNKRFQDGNKLFHALYEDIVRLGQD